MALFRSNYQMEGNNIRNLKVNRHSQVNKAKVFKKRFIQMEVFIYLISQYLKIYQKERFP